MQFDLPACAQAKWLSLQAREARGGSGSAAWHFVAASRRGPRRAGWGRAQATSWRLGEAGCLPSASCRAGGVWQPARHTEGGGQGEARAGAGLRSLKPHLHWGLVSWLAGMSELLWQHLFLAMGRAISENSKL